MRLIPHNGGEYGMATFQNRLNRLFDSFLNEGEFMPTNEPLWPAVDVIDTPETLQIKAEVPGIDPKDIDISIVGNALTIKGAKNEEREEKGKTWYRRERSVGSFLRTVTLPVAVDADHVEAVDESGVLTITLPKLEQEKAKFIRVKAKK
jgi:HSP20 family protein